MGKAYGPEGEAFEFERRMLGSNPEQLNSLAAWLVEQEAEEVVMESTAQYWKPVWAVLERYWKPLREEQRLWRTVTRKKYQLRRNRVRLQNQLEALLDARLPLVVG